MKSSTNDAGCSKVKSLPGQWFSRPKSTMLVTLTCFALCASVPVRTEAAEAPDAVRAFLKQNLVIPTGGAQKSTLAGILAALAAQGPVSIAMKLDDEMANRAVDLRSKEVSNVLDQVAEVTSTRWKAEGKTIVFRPANRLTSPALRLVRRMGRLGNLDAVRAAVGLLQTLTESQRQQLLATGYLPYSLLTEAQRSRLLAVPTGRVMPVVDELNVPLVSLPVKDLYFLGGFYLSMGVKLSDVVRQRLYLFRNSVGPELDIISPLRGKRSE